MKESAFLKMRRYGVLLKRAWRYVRGDNSGTGEIGPPYRAGGPASRYHHSSARTDTPPERSQFLIFHLQARRRAPPPGAVVGAEPTEFWGKLSPFCPFLHNLAPLTEMASARSNGGYKGDPGQEGAPRHATPRHARRRRRQERRAGVWREHLLPLHTDAIAENIPFVIPFPISIKSDISSKLNPPGGK